jgi:hypothetical protein
MQQSALIYLVCSSYYLRTLPLEFCCLGEHVVAIFRFYLLLNSGTVTLHEPSMYLEMSWNSTIMISAFSYMDPLKSII